MASTLQFLWSIAHTQWEIWLHNCKKKKEGSSAEISQQPVDERPISPEVCHPLEMEASCGRKRCRALSLSLFLIPVLFGAAPVATLGLDHIISPDDVSEQQFTGVCELNNSAGDIQRRHLLNERGRNSNINSNIIWPVSTGLVSLNATKSIAPGVTYNANFLTFELVFNNSGSQLEGQRPVFLLGDRATLQSAIIGLQAADGIHCMGSCTLRNVFWTDVGEDAATLRAQYPEAIALIDGGAAQFAADKVFQQHGVGTFVIQNFYAYQIGQLYRSCGDCPLQRTRHVIIKNVTVDTADVIAGINGDMNDTARISNLTVIYPKVRPKVCVRYHTALPLETRATGPDATNCIYSENTDVRYFGPPVPPPHRSFSETVELQRAHTFYVLMVVLLVRWST